MSERIIEFNVPKGAKAGRADKIFAAQFDDVSRVRLQRAFESGLVTFDGQVIDKRFKVNQPGLLRAVLEEPDLGEGPKAVAIPLDIIYEDESLVVVNKMPGMITHPGSGTGDDTLVHALLHHCKGNLPGIGGVQRPGIVHRLDKETSGLIVVAKNDLAHHKLASAFSERETYKRYTALVQGVPKISRGSVKEPIGRHPVMRTKMAVVFSGKEAHTDWQVVQRFGSKAAMISCVIHTGRTHQIRVHLSSLKFPILGDPTYGYKASRLKELQVPRVMLHSTELHIQHPERDELMQFIAPLPDDFNEIIEKLS
ncbi:MAG: RluA family pseudouridine synthase [Opitutales bacterium]|nr:RluA family pseudouridine synthase [Opitutales bacterium]